MRPAVCDQHPDPGPCAGQDCRPDRGCTLIGVRRQWDHAPQRCVGTVHAGVWKECPLLLTEEEPRNPADDAVTLPDHHLGDAGVHMVLCCKTLGLLPGSHRCQFHRPPFCRRECRLGDHQQVPVLKPAGCLFCRPAEDSGHIVACQDHPGLQSEDGERSGHACPPIF